MSAPKVKYAEHADSADITKAQIEAELTGEISSHSHAAGAIPQATESTLGGIKAAAIVKVKTPTLEDRITALEQEAVALKTRVLSVESATTIDSR